jgi:hypothetical protein
MKTPEQQAAEYAIKNGHKANLTNAYLAGYNAAGNKWVDVRDRLPEESGYYMCKTTNPDVPVYVLHFSVRYEWGQYKEYVTHWQPLPTTEL